MTLLLKHPYTELRENKKLDCLDITKFVMCIMIVMLHTSFFLRLIFPYVSVAVPMFFIISAYFLFCKLNAAPTDGDKKRVIFKYVKRNLQLYLFWLIALIPVTAAIRSFWFDDGVLIGLGICLRNFLFNSTFIASWFIMASVIASLIIFALRRVNSAVMLFLSGFSFLACCFTDIYAPLTFSVPALATFSKYYRMIFTNGANSFPFALFWMSLGRWFADSALDKRYDKIARYLLIISVGLLVMERTVVERAGWGIYGGTLALVPVCGSLFYVLKNIDISFKYGRILRKASTIIYASHASLRVFIGWLIPVSLYRNTVLMFFLTSAVCAALVAVILFAERYRPFRWLRYSH